MQTKLSDYELPKSSCRIRLLRRKLCFLRIKRINNVKPHLRLINCEKMRQELKAKIVWDLDYLVSNLTKHIGPLDSKRAVFIDVDYPERGNISITNLEGEVFIKIYESEIQMTDKSIRFHLDVYKDFKMIKEMTIEGRDKVLYECKILFVSELSPLENFHKMY